MEKQARNTKDLLDQKLPAMDLPKELASIILNFQGTEYIQALLTQWKIDHKELKFLNKGSYAKVFWGKDNRKKVLKITKDEADAQALMPFVLKPDKNFVKVYSIARLGQNNVYAILAEKLTPLSGLEHNKWDELFDYIYEQWHISPDKYGGIGREWLSDLHFTLEENALYSAFEEEFLQCVEWANALVRRNIDFWDLHAGNIMKRGRQTVLVELGLATAPAKKIPVIRLN